LSSDHLQVILQAEEGKLARYCMIKEEYLETHTVTSNLSISRVESLYFLEPSKWRLLSYELQCHVVW
jgi:hypothetical protein